MTDGDGSEAHPIRDGPDPVLSLYVKGWWSGPTPVVLVGWERSPSWNRTDDGVKWTHETDTGLLLEWGQDGTGYGLD